MFINFVLKLVLRINGQEFENTESVVLCKDLFIFWPGLCSNGWEYWGRHWDLDEALRVFSFMGDLNCSHRVRLLPLGGHFVLFTEN